MHVSSSASAQRRKNHHATQPDDQTWDPGMDQEPEERSQLCKMTVPEHLCSLSSAAMASGADVSEGEPDVEESRTEMDSHANMPVAGRNACMTSDTGRIADVNAFTPDHDSMMTSIVDAAVRHDCPCDGQACIFVTRAQCPACSVDEEQSHTSLRNEGGRNHSKCNAEDSNN
jgi:hypothetical protein